MLKNGPFGKAIQEMSRLGLPVFHVQPEHVENKSALIEKEIPFVIHHFWVPCQFFSGVYDN